MENRLVFQWLTITSLWKQDIGGLQYTDNLKDIFIYENQFFLLLHLNREELPFWPMWIAEVNDTMLERRIPFW